MIDPCRGGYLRFITTKTTFFARDLSYVSPAASNTTCLETSSTVISVTLDPLRAAVDFARVAAGLTASILPFLYRGPSFVYSWSSKILHRLPRNPRGIPCAPGLRKAWAVCLKKTRMRITPGSPHQ